MCSRLFFFLAGFFMTLGLAVLPSASQTQQATLDEIKKRGSLNCGVTTGVAGFSSPDDAGNWTGFDVDLCRALAAAIFDDPTKVKFFPLSSKERFQALVARQIDVLSRVTTWTMSRDTELGLDFTYIHYYDGQGFLVPKSLGVTSAKELDGASVCTQTGTTSELNMSDYFRKNNMSYDPVIFEDYKASVAAFQAGRCQVFTNDASGLSAVRLRFANPDDYVVLPEIISKEPLGPLVRQNDSAWADIVRWTGFALINAEELGITSSNVDEKLKSDNPMVKRFLGIDSTFGEGIGLTNDWTVRIIKAVGNYGEIFKRHLGPETPLNINRGINKLWTDGGLQYAPPVR